MSLDSAALQAHYRRAEPVYDALATVEEYPTIGLNDFVGWYIKRDQEDIEVIEAGYPRRGRVARLDRDYEELLDRLDRTLYAVTTYKTPAAFQRWTPCRYDDDEGTTVWQDEPPTPDYADLRAIPAWGDIDLADDIKPDRGNLDEDARALIEETLAAYVEEFADLYGKRAAVNALDSVGGAYIFGAPEATLPIADHFTDDLDALAHIFDAFLDRSNAWLEDAEARVNDRIDGAADVIHPDWVNNKNRQYKPPLSLHADYDTVVTPLDIDDIQYDLCPVEAVTDATIDRATTWADAFTRVEHTDCVASLVATLWPDAYSDHGDWQTALEAWVANERASERDRRRQRAQALRHRQERREERGDSLSGWPITPFKQEVYEAVEEVDITEIARHHASDAYDTDPAQPRPQFDPSWRHSESGQSCFVDDQANTFGDSKVNAGGGPAKLMALASGTIEDAREELDGEAYWAAVDELREAGYAIPVWIPEAGSKRVDGDPYDQMPFWAVKKAAVALGVCPQDEFIDRECEDGTYEGFPGYETYNDALAAITDAGLTHGRDPVTPPTDADENASIPQTATPDPGDSLGRAHLREKVRLLEAKVERLTNTIDEQAETIERLDAANARLATQRTPDQQGCNKYEHDQEGDNVTPTPAEDPDQSKTQDSDDTDSLITRTRRVLLFQG